MKRILANAAVLMAAALTLVACGHNEHAYDDHVGWVALIDGTRPALDNWNRGGTATANWRFEYGNIVADALTGKGSSHLISKNSYTDFHLRAEFWSGPKTNSGIFIRCTDPKKIASTTCYEVNIYDTRPDPSYGTGAIVGVATVNPMPRADGHWNTMEITARGNRLTVWFNGRLTVDVVDNKFKSGPFTLQYGSGAIKWRKVQIKPIV
jgi:Domain of Unknown Function (DUF1080).